MAVLEEGRLLMKLIHWLFVLSAASFLSATPLVEAQVPSILETTGDFPGGGRLWISAETAADKMKIINLDLIGSDAVRKRVEKQRQDLGDRLPAEAAKTRAGGKPIVASIPDAECKSRTMNVDDRGGIGSSDSLANLAVHSKMIVRGTIRTVDVGFSFGAPISLLGVEVSEVIKGIPPKSPFYVDYPVARFRIGPFSFCNLTKGFEPRPGDELLLFAYSGPVDRDEILYAPRLDQMLFQSQDGTIFLPSPLRDKPVTETARTLDDVISPLKSFLAIYGDGQ
jgi:hypothetical protein